jgi:hypothetical protein
LLVVIDYYIIGKEVFGLNDAVSEFYEHY